MAVSKEKYKKILAPEKIFVAFLIKVHQKWALFQFLSSLVLTKVFLKICFRHHKLETRLATAWRISSIGISHKQRPTYERGGNRVIPSCEADVNQGSCTKSSHILWHLADFPCARAERWLLGTLTVHNV